MNDDNNEHGSGFWFGLAIGGLVGAVGSYLLTTDEKERKKLLARGKQILEGLEDFGGEALEKGEEIKDEVVAKVQKVTKVVEEKAPEIQEKAEEVSEDIEEIAKDAIEKIAAVTQKAQKTGVKRFFSKGKALK
jgi:gas vesicle protein